MQPIVLHVSRSFVNLPGPSKQLLNPCCAQALILMNLSSPDEKTRSTRMYKDFICFLCIFVGGFITPKNLSNTPTNTLQTPPKHTSKYLLNPSPNTPQHIVKTIVFFLFSSGGGSILGDFLELSRKFQEICRNHP